MKSKSSFKGDLTPRLIERSRLEYLAQSKERDNTTFTPTLNKKSKNLCKQRQTLKKNKEGKSQVSPILFYALHYDAEE